MTFWNIRWCHVLLASVNIWSCRLVVWVCSIILPQSHHLGAMKTNQEDQDQVLKDQRRRISTSPAETNVSTRSKDETDGPVPLSRFFGNLKSWLFSSLLQYVIFFTTSHVLLFVELRVAVMAHIINQFFYFSFSLFA